MVKFLKTPYQLIGLALLVFSIWAVLAIFKSEIPDSDVSQETKDLNENASIRSGLFMVGCAYTKTGNPSPLLLFINPDNLSMDRVNLSKFPDLDSAGIHEARPFMLDNQYKLALGTYYDDPDKPGKVVILSSPDMSWENLQVEFAEELDERVRAVFIGDIDNDGKEELVVGTRPNGILKYYKFAQGQWSGTVIDKINQSIHDVLIADSDGDGLNEIIITTSLERVEKSPEQTSILPKILKYEFDQDQGKWNKETIWEFTKKVEEPGTGIARYEHARYLFFEDFNEDGTKEIVTNIISSGNLISLKWNGAGYSEDVIEDNLTLSEGIIISGDINNDGKSEIITSNLTNDALLLYQWEEGKWKREVLTKELLADAEKGERIIAMTILNFPSGGYKKIFYATSYTETTSFYILEYEPLKDVWEKKHIEDLEFNIAPWGIFPAFP